MGGASSSEPYWPTNTSFPRINDSLGFRDTAHHSRLFLSWTSPTSLWLPRGGAHAGSCRRLSRRPCWRVLGAVVLAAQVGTVGVRPTSYCSCSVCLFSLGIFLLQAKLKACWKSCSPKASHASLSSAQKVTAFLISNPVNYLYLSFYPAYCVNKSEHIFFFFSSGAHILLRLPFARYIL